MPARPPPKWVMTREDRLRHGSQRGKACRSDRAGCGPPTPRGGIQPCARTRVISCFFQRCCCSRRPLCQSRPRMPAPLCRSSRRATSSASTRSDGSGPTFPRSSGTTGTSSSTRACSSRSGRSSRDYSPAEAVPRPRPRSTAASRGSAPTTASRTTPAGQPFPAWTKIDCWVIRKRA